MSTSTRRYVLRGVPGGWRIFDKKRKRFWGELYELCPDELLQELNGEGRAAVITDLLKAARQAKR